MKWSLVLCLLAVSTAVGAVVIRADVDDARYLIAPSAIPALAEMPGEGQGVLIAPRWVVTAAHATQGYMLMGVRVHGTWRKVAHVYLYPRFKEQYARVEQAAKHPTLKNRQAITEAFEAMHDIALIELAQPVEDVQPMPLYRASNEQGKVVKIIGRGATGNGKVGQYPHSPHRGKLRRAFNRITRAHAQWLDYRFDCGPDALPLEGVIGDGDSGGPVLIESDGTWKLAGLSDWKHWPKGHATFVAGVCGQSFSNSRISYYTKWIKGVMDAHSDSTSHKLGVNKAAKSAI
ncbi:trypsin-like serine protease [Oleiagrimonas sp. MCCC 1A03011]|uniref:S1 family peptidase n=1 Tax=Oleiagrimonas sp. MCCC 1A03011 TaxID=1926883 RepID=UPI000DC52088|nr:trypsin-like serine protease [Oleiagrimonas sp. MCCC 1A03011]RAP56297.1 hypothetical protein BTJ49_13670 [Oleiagrimonas sp. MCCC 1A03011]